MDPELERVLRGLKEAAEFAKTYRFEMTDDYLALLARVEAMPQNQSGADKSHVWPGLQGTLASICGSATNLSIGHAMSGWPSGQSSKAPSPRLPDQPTSRPTSLW